MHSFTQLSHLYPHWNLHDLWNVSANKQILYSTFLLLPLWISKSVSGASVTTTLYFNHKRTGIGGAVEQATDNMALLNICHTAKICSHFFPHSFIQKLLSSRLKTSLHNWKKHRGYLNHYLWRIQKSVSAGSDQTLFKGSFFDLRPKT